MQTDPSFALQTAKGRRATILLLPILVFALVAVARIMYVSLYAAPLPFWDQWDELDRQIRPWFYGSGHFLQLFAPHGGHRIAFTRVISLLLARINGHVFDNLVESFFNALIYAVTLAALFTLLTCRDNSKVRLWLIAIAIVLLGLQPFDWENTLIGFQNQFYLLELSPVVVIGIAAYSRLSRSTLVVLMVLALASLFTMGSGFLAAPAACVAVCLRAWREPGCRKRGVVAVGVLVLVAVCGLVLLLLSKRHTAFGAHGPSQLITALLVCLMWPLQHPLQASHWLFAAMLWAPSVVWIVRYWRGRRGDADEVFAFALAVWVLLQFLAIAEARGHDMRFLPSRYSEIPAIGIIANLWLALKLVSVTRTQTRNAFSWVLACGIVLVGWAFWRRTPGDLQAMQQRHVITTIETINVRHYLAGEALPALPDGSLDLPYPSAQRLRDLLGSAEIRALLPPTVFPTSDRPHLAPLSMLAADLQRSIRGWFPDRVWQVSTSTLAALTPAPFNAYSSTIPAEASDTQCSLDVIDGKPAASVKTIDRNAAVLFQGWAGNGQSQPVGNGLFILKGTRGDYAAPFSTDVERPDVAHALHSGAMARSGFNLTAKIKHVQAGTYSLFVAAPAKPTTVCDLHRTLTVQ